MRGGGPDSMTSMFRLLDPSGVRFPSSPATRFGCAGIADGPTTSVGHISAVVGPVCRPQRSVDMGGPMGTAAGDNVYCQPAWGRSALSHGSSEMGGMVCAY
jgi:hypothetical protein